MKKLIVSDIFGCTPVLQEFANDLLGNCEVVEPYQGTSMAFVTEEEAYQHFMSHVGLETYTETLANKIKIEQSPVMLIGFSVGASAIWSLSAQLTKKQVSGAFGFYGSQIRKALHISPQFPLNLIMPRHESFFSVEQLSETLQTRQNVSVYPSNFLHGFMNPYSKNFDEQGYQEFFEFLQENSEL